MAPLTKNEARWKSCRWVDIILFQMMVMVVPCAEPPGYSEMLHFLLTTAILIINIILYSTIAHVLPHNLATVQKRNFSFLVNKGERKMFSKSFLPQWIPHFKDKPMHICFYISRFAADSDILYLALLNIFLNKAAYNFPVGNVQRSIFSNEHAEFYQDETMKMKHAGWNQNKLGITHK